MTRPFILTQISNMTLDNVWVTATAQVSKRSERRNHNQMGGMKILLKMNCFSVFNKIFHLLP